MVPASAVGSSLAHQPLQADSDTASERAYQDAQQYQHQQQQYHQLQQSVQQQQQQQQQDEQSRRPAATLKSRLSPQQIRFQSTATAPARPVHSGFIDMAALLSEVQR